MRFPSVLLGLALFAASTILSTAASAAGQTPAPAGPERWISQWDEGVCRLVRARGDPPTEPYLMLEVIPGSETVELWLVNPDLDLPRNRGFANVSMRLEPGGAEHSIYVHGYNFRGDRYYVLYLPATLSLDTLASANALRLDRSGRQLLAMPLPPFQQALPVLRDCMNDLLRSWGFDPGMYNALRQPPRSVGNIASWVSDGDYPYSALRDNHSGRTVARVTVGADGRARNCAILVSAGHEALDSRTCAVSRRGRFDPALDAEGRPTEAPLIYSITWRIQG